MQKQKGFTIIELIVVIAIIAVLAAIVLVNVTQYIAKGKDASITGNLASVMTNAAVFYDTHSSTYTGLCTSATVKAALDAVDATRGDTGKSACNVDISETATVGTTWAACAQLVNDKVNALCVDSTGTKKTIAAATCVTAWTATVCP